MSYYAYKIEKFKNQRTGRYYWYIMETNSDKQVAGPFDTYYAAEKAFNRLVTVPQ